MNGYNVVHIKKKTKKQKETNVTGTLLHATQAHTGYNISTHFFPVHTCLESHLAALPFLNSKKGQVAIFTAKDFARTLDKNTSRQNTLITKMTNKCTNPFATGAY